METISVAPPDLYSAKTFDPRTGFGRLLSQVKMELMEALDRFMVTVGDDQELLSQVTPVGMDEFNATTFDRPGVRYGSVITCARPPGLRTGVSYDPGAMTRMIDRLERKGLVRRIRCPDDRRKINLELTPEGKAVYPRLIESVVAVLNRYLRGFSRDEITQFETFLKRMLANG